MNTKRILATLGVVAAMGASTLVPGMASAAAPENSLVWRAQVTFQTADKSDAGTDDSIAVELNGANHTWLDYGRDDFERGSTFTYDLGLGGVSRLSDIQMLKVSKTGSDGWCPKSYTLRINDRDIFTQSFASVSGGCRWFDNDGSDTRSFTVDYGTLRASAQWQAFSQPFPPFTVARAELESRIESMVGNQIHGNPLEWGQISGRAVEVSRKNDTTLKVDLDLEVEVPNWFNPEVDVDFDVKVSCAGGVLSLNAENMTVNVDSSWYSEVLSFGLIEFVDNEIQDQMNAGLKNLMIAQNQQIGTCPTITINPDGSLSFSLPVPRQVLVQPQFIEGVQFLTPTPIVRPVAPIRGTRGVAIP